MANNPKKPAMEGCGGVVAWLVIFCLFGALAGGAFLKGCANGIDSFGNAMRTMAGDTDDGE